LRFDNGAGASTPVRWSTAAVDPFEPEPPAQPAAQNENYLFDAVIARIGQTPIQRLLVVTIAEVGDPTDDASAVQIPGSGKRA
jgi:catalase